LEEAARASSHRGLDYLSILLLGKGALERAFLRVSQSVSWSLIPQGPARSSEKTEETYPVNNSPLIQKMPLLAEGQDGDISLAIPEESGSSLTPS
jgi:hypothetical protein